MENSYYNHFFYLYNDKKKDRKEDRKPMQGQKKSKTDVV